MKYLEKFETFNEGTIFPNNVSSNKFNKLPKSITIEGVSFQTTYELEADEKNIEFYAFIYAPNSKKLMDIGVYYKNIEHTHHENTFQFYSTVKKLKTTELKKLNVEWASDLSNNQMLSLLNIEINDNLTAEEFITLANEYSSYNEVKLFHLNKDEMSKKITIANTKFDMQKEYSNIRKRKQMNKNYIEKLKEAFKKYGFVFSVKGAKCYINGLKADYDAYNIKLDNQNFSVVEDLIKYIKRNHPIHTSKKLGELTDKTGIFDE